MAERRATLPVRASTEPVHEHTRTLAMRSYTRAARCKSSCMQQRGARQSVAKACSRFVDDYSACSKRAYENEQRVQCLHASDVRRCRICDRTSDTVDSTYTTAIPTTPIAAAASSASAITAATIASAIAAADSVPAGV